MAYFDSNVFIYAVIYSKAVPQATEARVILECTEKGLVKAYTSTLTWDELVWVVRKTLGRRDAEDKGRMLLQFPNLKFINVGESTILQAQKLVERYGLKPRDAIHAAAALDKNLTMVSDDTDFDVVKGLKRISIKEFSTKLQRG
ncbi:MAG: type II toxin-antitoxin system VapC family toxin [Candidatus Freyrarchaeum guaymaensis]